MDSRLTNLIHSYQLAVKEAVQFLESKSVPLPKTNFEWALTSIKNINFGDVRVRKHGYGCEVFLADGVVDFDFGKNGEVSGFDFWRLLSFMESCQTDFGFADEADLRKAFDLATEKDEIVFSDHALFQKNIL